MDQSSKCRNWRVYAGVWVAVLAGITVLAAFTGLWVLTAVPVGFLFGFFLQKGELCAALAFSQVILMKDPRRLWAMWVAVVTGMLGFAILDLLGWAELTPKPLAWMNMTLGGVLFGVGIVMAGGCVSGSLFKTGVGHLSSMVALPAIALGMAAVTHGQLAPLDRMMRTRVIEASDGRAVTVATMTGLPFWALALLFAVATLIAGGVFKLTRKKKGMAVQSVGAIEGAGARILTARSWKPWKAGIAIGILGAFAFLSSTASGRNQPLGVAYGVYFTQVLITDMQVKHVWKPGQAPEMPPAMTPPDIAAAKKTGRPPFGPPREKPVSWWLVLLVISLVAGAQAAARLSGEAKLYPKPPEQMIIAFAGGLLIGLGAGIAQGCMVCNILSGWAMMSAGSVLFGVTAVLASWATTYFYLMGGSLFRARE